MQYEYMDCMGCAARFLSRPGGTYCSKVCRRSSLDKKYRIQCAKCGDYFVSNRGTKKVLYCSNKCALSSRFRRQSSNWICAMCGITFICTKNYAKYCSNKCRLSVSGALHPAWTVGTRHVRGKGWLRARDYVWLRDLVCQTPGCLVDKKINGRNLCVDHIIPYRVSNETMYAHDIRNLICLCSKHHGSKVAAERRLYIGDFLGFISIAKNLIPKKRFNEAIFYWTSTLQGDGNEDS